MSSLSQFMNASVKSIQSGVANPTEGPTYISISPVNVDKSIVLVEGMTLLQLNGAYIMRPVAANLFSTSPSEPSSTICIPNNKTLNLINYTFFTCEAYWQVVEFF